MSEEEKNRNVVAAVNAVKAAKERLANVGDVLKRAAAASSELSHTLTTPLGAFYETQIVEGKIRFGLSNSKSDAADLLNEQGLLALLNERDQARAALSEAQDHLSALGFGCLK